VVNSGVCDSRGISDFHALQAYGVENGGRPSDGGIVSKKLGLRYRSGEQDTWINSKCRKAEAYPIVAFVEKLGARPRRIASLYVGRRDGDRLLYAGKVGTGYTEAQLYELRERLDPLIRGFKGIRDDLLPQAAQSGAANKSRQPSHHQRVRVPKENILQLLPDAVIPSEEQLTRYWRKVAPRALKPSGGSALEVGTLSHHGASTSTNRRLCVRGHRGRCGGRRKRHRILKARTNRCTHSPISRIHGQRFYSESASDAGCGGMQGWGDRQANHEPTELPDC
jgi:hypothetical protein